MLEMEFVKGMKRLISLYRTDMSDTEMLEWYDRFKDYDADTFYRAVNKIKSKYMPNAIELQELVENEIVSNNFKILDLMWNDGYFKYGDYGELAPEQQSRNFEKAMMWLNTGVIPGWFQEDLNRYYEKQKNETKAIGDTNGRTNLQLPNK